MNQEEAKDQLIQLYENKIADLVAKSQIELDPAFTAAVIKLKMLINSVDMDPEWNRLISENFWDLT